MIFPKKPQILYAPMLATFGGGSVRGFRAGGPKADPQGYAVATSSNGTKGLLHFDPVTMTAIASIGSTDGYHNSQAFGSMQNVIVDDAGIFANHGYTSNNIANWADKYNPSNGAQSSWTSGGQGISADKSRSNIAADKNWLYFGTNDGRFRKMQKSSGYIADVESYSGGEMYANSLDQNFIYVGGGVNSGNLGIYQRSNFNYQAQVSLTYQNTMLCVASDDTYVYTTGAWSSPYTTYDNFYRIDKANIGSTNTSTLISSNVSSGYGGYTTAICVDDSHIYTCGYNTNRITKWNKAPSWNEHTSQVISYTSAKYGQTYNVDHVYGMNHDADYLYLACKLSNGHLRIVKVQKSNMTVVDDLRHQHGTDWNFFSGGRHITLDNQVGGPAFFTKNGVSDWHVNNNSGAMLT